MSRVRMGARGALLLGVAVSIVANMLHAAPNPISRVIAAWAPLALWLAIELIAKVPVRHGWRSVVRLLAAAGIAGIAAYVSYWHMVGVALRYGETGAAPYLIPLTVDGLVVVAWVCLVELGGRTEPRGQITIPAAPAPVYAHDEPIGPEPAPANLTTSPAKLAGKRKPHPSSAVRVERAHQRTPDATNRQLADRLKLSPATVKRYRPAAQVNGSVPDLVESSDG